MVKVVVYCNNIIRGTLIRILLEIANYKFQKLILMIFKIMLIL